MITIGSAFLNWDMTIDHYNDKFFSVPEEQEFNK